VSDDRPTPKETGSFVRATACVVICDNLARKLSAKAREVALESGRPDLRYARLARTARDLSKNFSAWLQPAPKGRTHFDDRAIDRAAYEILIERAKTLGVEPTGP
jgi:hypothetical protein